MALEGLFRLLLSQGLAVRVLTTSDDVRNVGFVLVAAVVILDSIATRSSDVYACLDVPEDIGFVTPCTGDSGDGVADVEVRFGLSGLWAS